MKIFKRILLIFFTLITVVMSAVFTIDRVAFASFYQNANKEMANPGVWTGFTSQGFDYLKEENKYLMTGYNKDGVSPSVIYIVDGTSNKTQGKVELFKENGENYTGHVGGICHYGKYVYITHGKSCSLFLLSDVLDGDGKATQQGKVPLAVSAAYCYVQDGHLYTGEYYYPEKYETPMENRLTTPAGDNNMAILAVYKLDEKTSLPASDTPVKLFSTVGMVQGMCFTDSGKIILSTSWGLSISKLYVYDLSKMPVPYSTQGAVGTNFGNNSYSFTLNGEEIPLYYLDSACLQEVIQAPPMAEELVYRNGRVYIANESAGMKYIFGKFTSAAFVYSYPIK